ncbi:SP_0009 family protein [Streptococcus caviae]|nr:SP_0009 family protein [Streptococcus sp. 'caviae']OLN82391.1 recombinase [Streptococcus sp. 'caviae']
MEHLIETVEKFLAYSDDKLEELAQKNQALREEPSHKMNVQNKVGGAK